MFRKSIQLSLALSFLFAAKAGAQNVAINESGATAHASAMLDVQSTTKGLLAPRMTKAQRDAIGSPATGLLIYQTNETPGFYYYQGTAGWIRLNTGSGSGGSSSVNGWSFTGNNINSEHFLGTTNYQDLVFKTNNIEVGRLKVPGGSGAVMFGQNTSAAQNALALATDAKANSNNSVAIGKSAIAGGDGAMVIGYGANSTNANYAVVIGSNANSNGEQAIVLGKDAATTGSSQGIAIGSGAKTSTYRSIAIGSGANVETSSDGIALGVSAKATGYRSVAIGAEAQSTKQNSIILGNLTAQVGIGTSEPKDGAKLDVNGTVKLGTQGSVLKNVITGIDNGGYKSVPANSSLDYEVTLTGSFPGMHASVAVSPSIDLPAGVYIAYARLSAANKVKIRFVNTGSTPANFYGDLYITVTEF